MTWWSPWQWLELNPGHWALCSVTLYWIGSHQNTLQLDCLHSSCQFQYADRGCLRLGEWTSLKLEVSYDHLTNEIKICGSKVTATCERKRHVGFQSSLKSNQIASSSPPPPIECGLMSFVGFLFSPKWRCQESNNHRSPSAPPQCIRKSPQMRWTGRVASGNQSWDRIYFQSILSDGRMELGHPSLLFLVRRGQTPEKELNGIRLNPYCGKTSMTNSRFNI